VLGPIFFLIYINGLYQLGLRARLVGYADDASLLYSATSEQQVREDFNHDQNLLLPWLEQNLLHLNIETCVVVVSAFETPGWAHSFTLDTKQGDI